MAETAAIVGTVIAILGAPFAIRKLWHLYKPINVSVTVQMSARPKRDRVIATITNVSNESQVVVNCTARATWPLAIVILKHFRNPFLRPRMYPALRYSGFSFDLLNESTIKLEPKDRKTLDFVFSDHPMHTFAAPMVVLEVELSSGRKFRSKRLEVPDHWMTINHPEIRRNLRTSESDA